MAEPVPGAGEGGATVDLPGLGHRARVLGPVDVELGGQADGPAGAGGLDEGPGSLEGRLVPLQVPLQADDLVVRLDHREDEVLAAALELGAPPEERVLGRVQPGGAPARPRGRREALAEAHPGVAPAEVVVGRGGAAVHVELGPGPEPPRERQAIGLGGRRVLAEAARRAGPEPDVVLRLRRVDAQLGALDRVALALEHVGPSRSPGRPRPPASGSGARRSGSRPRGPAGERQGHRERAGRERDPHGPPRRPHRTAAGKGGSGSQVRQEAAQAAIGENPVPPLVLGLVQGAIGPVEGQVGGPAGAAARPRRR